MQLKFHATNLNYFGCGLVTYVKQGGDRTEVRI